jgi:hypothetical protein
VRVCAWVYVGARARHGEFEIQICETFFGVLIKVQHLQADTGRGAPAGSPLIHSLTKFTH